MFGEATRKLELYLEECNILIGDDIIGKTFANHIHQLQVRLLGSLQSATIDTVCNMEYRLQELKLEREDLRYNYKVS